MRAIERIPIFMDAIMGQLVTMVRRIRPDMDIMECVGIGSRIMEQRENLIAYWNDNPDLRFTQVLISLGILQNQPGPWYYFEEEEILEMMGVNPRDYLLWGQYFDKDGKRLSKVIRRPVKDMDTDHIKAILDGEWTSNPDYIKCFTEELKRRGAE